MWQNVSHEIRTHSDGEGEDSQEPAAQADELAERLADHSGICGTADAGRESAVDLGCFQKPTLQAGQEVAADSLC